MGRSGRGRDPFRAHNQSARRAVGRSRRREHHYGRGRGRGRDRGGPPVIDPLTLSVGRLSDPVDSPLPRDPGPLRPATRLVVGPLLAIGAWLMLESLAARHVLPGIVALGIVLGFGAILRELLHRRRTARDEEDAPCPGRGLREPERRRRGAWRVRRYPPPADLPRPEAGEHWELGEPVEDPYPLELLEPVDAGLGLCPFCNCGLEDETVWICDRCETPHHAECWRSAGRCTIYACDSKRFRRLSGPLQEREPGEFR